ncbi:MAG: hypothetical protein K8L99_20435 [Anaerolineae bacterium]|jgi:hypothetical protein|nr:hypothetical protein [Anaerolineae bacterium]MCL4722652.1 hypothetical protein [Rhodocyclaceae bacterium]MCZ2113579.1 hypothetical protein [Anaerolineae bacterium]GIK44863.1 MAG: hypothetical protein BroJett012_07660 [Betaproteobacteria bacterium]
MKSTPTPHVATGVTIEEMTVTFGATGSMQHQVTVPAGTKCKKLDGGSNPWVVDDLRFITNKQSILYSDADIYGIRIPENKITDIKEVCRG